MATEPLDSTRNAAAKLDPKLAFFLPNSEAQSIPLTNAKEVRVAWSFSTDDNYAELEQYLTYYTWPTNKDKEQRYVVDPIVGGTPLPGTWRQAFITRIERRGEDRQPEMLVVLTLRRGWAETIDWTEALLFNWKVADGNDVSVPAVSNTTSFDTAQMLTIHFPNIAPSRVRACLDSMPTTIAGTEGLSVQGIPLEQVWYRAACLATKQDDGSFVVECFLNRNRYTVELYQNYGAPSQKTGYRVYDVPRNQANDMAIAWRATGRSADIDLGIQRDMCTVTLWAELETPDDYVYISATNCSFYAQRTHYEGQVTIPATPQNSMGITYTAAFQQDGNSGKYNGWIEKRVRQTQHIPSYRGENTHEQYTMRERWVGVYTNSGVLQEATLSVAAGNISKSYANITLPDDTIALGNTWQISKRENEDCTIDIDIAERTEKAIDAIDYDSAENNAASTSTNEQFNLSSAVLTLTAGSNESVRANVRYNKTTGLLDVTEETTVSKQLDGSETTESAASTRTITRKRKASAVPAAPVQENGKIKTVSSEETEFADRYDTTELVDQAKNQTAGGGSARADQTSVVSVQTQATAQVAATPQAGKIVNVSNRPTDHGLFATSQEVITPINQADAEGTVRADQTSVVTKNTQADAAVLATPQTGKIVRVSNQSTEFGKVRTAVEVITPIDQTSTSGDDRGDRTSTTVEHTQASSAIIAPPAAATGTIVTVQNRETEFGLFNTREEVVTAKELGVTHVSLSGAAQTEETIRARNAASKADAIAIEGKIVRASSQKNEFNLYDNTVETITPIDQTGHAAQLRADQTSDIDTHTQSDTVADETPVTGKIVNADSQPTEFGKYRTRREVVTPVNQDGSAEEVRADRTSTTDTNTQSETEADATPVTGKIVQTQNRPTEFGKFSTSRTEITPVEQTTTHDSTARADQTAERTIATNAAAKQDATPVAGKVVNASSKENEFGKFDNTLETITPIDQTGESAEVRSDRTSATETHTQSDDSPDDTPVDGVIVQTQEAPTEFGKKRTVRTVITPIDQTAISNTEAHNEAIGEEVHTQADAALADAVEVVGEINEASSVPTEFGKFRTTDRTRTAKEQTVTHSSEVRADQTTDRTWESNAATKADAEDAGDGVITRATSQENGFGLFDNVKETTTAIDQTGAGASESHSESMTEETHTQGDALEDPVETTGKITENVSRPTAFGKYATTSRERSGKLQSVTHASESRADQTTERVWESNADEKAEADEVDGKIVQATSQENPFGLFDNVKQTITPKDQESTNGAEGHLSSSETKTHTQNDAEEDAGTPSAGQRISVDNQPTPFGKFRTAKQTETAIEVTTTDSEENGLSESSIEKTWNGNKIETAPSRGSGEVVSLVQSPTPFKDKWDIAESTETGTAWDTGWVGVNNANGAFWVRKWGNQEESFGEGVAEELSEDQINSYGQTKNRFGLFDGSASKQNEVEDDGTFWQSTKTKTIPLTEYRTIDDWDETAGDKIPTDQKRSVNLKTYYAVAQTLGDARSLLEGYMDNVPATADRDSVSYGINPKTDKGRNGWEVHLEYVDHGTNKWVKDE